MIKFDFKTYQKELNLDIYSTYKQELINKLNTSRDMMGWYHFDDILKESLNKIKEEAKIVREFSDVLVVIGIGGSSSGAKGIISALSPYFKKDNFEIIFAGESFSSEYLIALKEHLKDKRVTLNVISKSGETLETSLTFEYLYEYLKTIYNESELRNHIYITTDEFDGSLRKFASEKNYKSFIIPKNVGGRFSMLTPVALFPIAVSGIDLDEFIRGASLELLDTAVDYALIRNIMHQDRVVESFTIYEPKLFYFTEWLKQLFAETECKNKKGLLPIITINSKDLHSVGQFYQEGTNILFETVISISNTKEIYINKYSKTLDDINNLAVSSVASAHKQANNYSNIILVDKLTAFNMGSLVMFFEISSVMGAYLLDVAPFNQPGVDAYKHILMDKLNNK